MWTIEQATEFTNAIIKELGGDWRVADRFPRGGSPAICGHEVALSDGETGRGLSFDLRSATSANKITISVHFPFSKDNYGPARQKGFDSINVSANRDVPAIVKDLTRRLLTGYPEAFTEAQATTKQRDANYENQKQQLTELSDIIGHELHSGQGQTIAYKHGVRQIEVNSDATTARLELIHIPLADAKAVLKLLAKRVKKS